MKPPQVPAEASAEVPAEASGATAAGATEVPVGATAAGTAAEARDSDAEPGSRPDWIEALAVAARDVDPADFGRLRPPAQGGKASAVLMLFSPDEAGRMSVVLTKRSARLRAHAGQVSFPGGRVDAEDCGPVAAALREAAEEVGLEGGGLDVLGTLPPVYVPVSDSVVTAVLAWSPRLPTLRVTSPQEVESVHPVPLDDLLDPAVRFVATHPNGYRGPAFELEHLYIWGFTAALLSGAFDLAGLTREWDRTNTRPLPQRYGRPVTDEDITRTRSQSAPDKAQRGEVDAP